jgi:hypothetical protein
MGEEDKKRDWQDWVQTIASAFTASFTAITALLMFFATASMAYFAWEANSLTDNSLKSDNRPDLLIRPTELKIKPTQVKSECGILVLNTGKGPASLLALWMTGRPEPYARKLNETYVPVNAQADDKRLATIFDEMIEKRKKEQPNWVYDEKQVAWRFYLVYKDIFENVYRQEFLWQTQPPDNPNPIWQKGCTYIGKVSSEDPSARRLFKRETPWAWPQERCGLFGE